ncbi:hypothetical protein AB0C69_11045 [Actinomadura sp. NPDC048032]|uniref:phage tail protein n=1 Tax=Actinomadura sp. NPDC048032 TaxID=3155747 RepID=UPI00340F8784
MALRLGELVAIISADDSKFHKALGRVHSGLQKVGKVGALAALAGAAGQLAVALGPAAGGVLSLGAALGAAVAPAAGVAVALPAIALTWKTSLAIMKLAVDDLSESLGAAIEGDSKKFQDALKKLPPAARSVASELGTALGGLKGTVQEAFFKPVAAQAKGLGKQLRGPLQQGMATAAAGLGRLAARAASVARERRSLATLSGVFRTIAVTSDRASAGVAPLLRGLREIVNVGLGKIPRVGTAVGNVATQMGRWLQNIARSGRASRWFDRGLRVLSQLGRIARNVGTALGAVFGAAATGAGNMLNPVERVTRSLARWSTSARGRAALLAFFAKGRQNLNQLARIAGNLGRALAGIFKNAGTGQADFLATLERLTARFAAWVNSAQGQQQIAQTFSMLNQVTHDLLTILPGLAVVLGQVAGFITSLPAPVRGAVTNFLAWSVVIGLVSGKIGPLILGVGKLAKGVGGVTRALRNNQSGLRRFLARMGGAFSTVGRWARQAAAAVGRAAASMARSAARGVAAAGRLAASGARALASAAATAGRAALSFIAAAGRMAASALLSAGRVVGAWALMGTQALIQGAKAAMFWVLANWPLVLFVAAVAAAVFLVIKYWDEIVEFFTKTLPHWIKVGLDWAIGIIKKAAKYGFFGPVGLIIAHWDKVKNFFSKTLPAFLKKGLDFVVGLVKKAASVGFFGPVGLIISHWGKISRFFTQTLPKAVSDGINKVLGWLRSLGGWVVRAVGDMGRLLVTAGKNVLIGFWNGMVSMASWLARSIGNLIRNIVPGPVLKVLGIHSPSKLFAGYGKNVAQGMAIGIADNKKLVSDAAGSLAVAASEGGGFGVARPGGRRKRARTGAAGGAQVVRLLLDFAGADAEFVKFFRKVVRVKSGGDVQVLVGRRV